LTSKCENFALHLLHSPNVLSLRLSTYLILAASAGGLSYYLYLVMFPKSKKSRAKRPKPTPAEPIKVTASGSSYQEEWIPVHHLKKGKGIGSGSELSGGETSGHEGKKRKGKK
jgi:translocon-associated protein subunit alpha